MINATPIVVILGVIISLGLILLDNWLFEDIGLALFGLSISILGITNASLFAFFYVGIFFFMLGIIIGILNLFAMWYGDMANKKISYDFFKLGARNYESKYQSYNKNQRE